MKIEYTNINGYLIPNLFLQQVPALEIGKYGSMRKQYLQEHRPWLYEKLLLSGTLPRHLAEINASAEEAVLLTVQRMAKAQGVTSELKRRDPLAWAGQMNAIKAAAEETVLPELLYTESIEPLI